MLYLHSGKFQATNGLENFTISTQAFKFTDLFEVDFSE
jgi:hypothetical protein